MINDSDFYPVHDKKKNLQSTDFLKKSKKSQDFPILARDILPF